MLVSFLKRPAPANPVAVARAKAIIWKCDRVTTKELAYWRLYRYPSSADAIAHTNYTVEDRLPHPRFKDEEALSDNVQYWARWSYIDLWDNESALSAAVNETNRRIIAADIEPGEITDALVDPTAPGTPTGLTVTQTAKTVDTGDGRVEVGVKVSWTAPVGGVPVRRYRIEISDGTDTVYKTVKNSPYKFIGVVGKTYTVKANSEALGGAESAQTSGVALSPSANTVAPATVAWEGSNPIVGKPKGVLLRVQKSNDIDYAETVFYRHTSNSSGSATEVGRSASNRFKDDDNLVSGTTYYYWAKHKNRSNVLSASFSTVQSIAYSGATTADIEPGSITDALVDQTAPGTPTGLAVAQTAKTVDTGDGRVEVGLKATWTAPVGGVPVRRYKVEVSDGTDTWYATTKQSSYKFWGVVSKTYTVRVNAESLAGVEGSQTTGVALAPSANAVAGSVPTWEALNPIVAKPKGNMLRFVQPSDSDFDQVAIYRNTSNNSGTATLIGKTRSDRYKDDEALSAGITYYYWLKGLNRSAVLTSSFSAVQSILARGTQTGDLEDGAVTSPIIAIDAVTPSRSSIGDPDNKVHDSDCVDVDEWVSTFGAVSSVGTTLTEEASNRLVTIASTSAGSIRQRRSMQVRPGRRYKAGGWFGWHSGSVGVDCSLFVQWFSRDAAGVESFLSNTLVATSSSTGQTSALETVTAPANARRAWLTVTKSATASAVQITFGAPIFRRSVERDHIPDGEINDSATDQTAPGTPTGLTVTQTAKTVDGGDGRVEVGMKATWTAPVGGVPVRRYKVEISDGTDTWYATTKQSSYKFFGVVGKTYTVKVSAEAFGGVEGSQTSGVALAPSANTAAGSVPTWEAGTAIVAKPKGNMLRFVMPADRDFDQVSIWRNTVNNSGTATEIGKTRSNRYKDDEDLAAGQAYFYWLKGINRSAVLTSSFSAASSITARGTQSGDIENGAVVAVALGAGVGVNYLPNSSQAAGKSGWGLEYSNGAASFQFNLRTDTYAPNPGALEIVQTTGVDALEYGIEPKNPDGTSVVYSVEVGARYELSTYYLGHRCDGVQLYLRWEDAAGALVSYSSLGVFTAFQNTNPAKSLSGYARAFGFATAPAGAVRVTPFFRQKGTLQGGGHTNCYLWLHKMFFGKALANQTEPSEWSPAPPGIVGVDDVDQTAPGTPTGLTLTQVAKNTDAGDGTVEIALRATWTAPSSGAPVKRYVLEISDGTDTWYRYSKKSSEKFPFVVGKNCTINVRAESFAGVEGTPTSNVVKTDVGGKTVAPSNVTSVSIVVRAGHNKIKFTLPSDRDIAGVNIYFNSVNNSGTATKIASEVKTDDYVDATARAHNDVCYYWVATVNRSGVEGTKVAASNNPQNAKKVQSADIVPQAITSVEMAPIAVVPSKLFPREFANLFSDPEMVETSNFSIIAGASSIVRVANDQTVGLGPGRFLISATSSNVATIDIELAGPIDIPVEAGVTYSYSTYISGTNDLTTFDPSGATFNATVYADFYRVDSSGQPSSFISSATLKVTVSDILGAYASGDFTAPANAQVARLRAKKTRIAGPTGFHTMYWGSPEVRRKVYIDEIFNDVFAPWNIPNAIGGLTLSNNASDATNDIDVSTGACADSTNALGVMRLNSPMTKRLDATFATGTGNGGRDTGSIADGVWHVWLIEPEIGGNADVLFSLSATSPTMPSGFVRKRRIGSIIRASGAIRQFRQNGDEFLLDTPVLDVDVTTQGTAAVTRTLTVPTGVKVDALVRVIASNASAYNVLLSALDVADAAPAGGAAPLATLGNAAGVNARQETRVRTNTSGQVRSRSDSASTTLRIATYGWIDKRF